MHQPYTVFRRGTKKKNRFVYYTQFRDADGRRTTALSTGKTTKAEALMWAQTQYAAGITTKKRCPRFEAFAAPWFLWDRCAYLARRRERGDYSRSYAEYQRSRLTLHLLPYFSTMRLDEITTAEIERWLIQTKNQSSPINANRALVVLKIMLKEAEREGHISKNPTTIVEGLPEASAPKGTLTISEVYAMFAHDALDSVWGDNRVHRTINALAFTTGMRMGEIQGLRWDDVQSNHIRVEHSWDRRYGLKPPKANSRRIVPLAATVAQWIAELGPAHDQFGPNTVVFHGENLLRPIDHKGIGKRFHRALDAIGIDEEQQRTRNLTFHSWRHTFHAIMRGTMSVVDLRRITGHRSARMTEHYDHVTSDLIRRVNPLIEEALTQNYSSS